MRMFVCVCVERCATHVIIPWDNVLLTVCCKFCYCCWWLPVHARVVVVCFLFPPLSQRDLSRRMIHMHSVIVVSHRMLIQYEEVAVREKFLKL